MPFSKDPQRYDPIYEYLLMEMEKGTKEFEVPLESEKKATNTRLTLYGYASAWKATAAEAARKNNQALESVAFAKYRTLTRYKVVQMDNKLLFISRDSQSFLPPTIKVIRGTEEDTEIVRAQDQTTPSVPPSELTENAQRELEALMNPNPQPMLRPVAPVDDEGEGENGLISGS